MPRRPEDIQDATLRLLLTPGIGPATLRKLRGAFGSDEKAVDAGVSELQSLPGVGRTTAQALRRAIEAGEPEAERRRMDAQDVRMILDGDEDYPALLAQIPDAPAALWVQGQLLESDRLSVAMVGSRQCTSYGREQAGRFAALLAESGLTIVSGGALGIDGEAHRGALRVGGRTIAVLGHGLNRPYPPQHEELFKKIVGAGGALVTEHPMDTEPRAQHFPRRNRIISGLSLGVLVVEAARRSGALITARLACEEHGREVMALPGRVDSPASQGCLKLLQDQSAALVLNHADVIRQLEASDQLVRSDSLTPVTAGDEHADSTNTALRDRALTEPQRAIVQVLVEANGAMLVDQIAARTNRPMSDLLADLTLLQIKGRVRRDHRGVQLAE